MRVLTTTIAMTGLLAAATAGTTSAVAGPPPVPAPSERHAAAPDGFVYAWDLPGGRGATCRWSGADRDWGDCTSHGTENSMLNRASDLWNNGVHAEYENVDFHWGKDQGGAWACLSRGDSWPNLTTGGQTFSHYYPWSAGKNERIDNNIASHRWSNDAC
ncbi:hypothetical protein HPO96_08285 [Kribbella sandramycini]|uniref:Peptidase inhibitor family I36 n=1 Tax=Kribbella sandramycini TaxID=60450 RepID=A0A7Y4KX56_9ACTN|nr:hypothetical protein [Kribbella sandramycini]MBB6569937.1 hypothetical protein [Kribbella sandramycini]NOL40239.1 hypothetical protein [Kribbella sandramycini]